MRLSGDTESSFDFMSGPTCRDSRVGGTFSDLVFRVSADTDELRLVAEPSIRTLDDFANEVVEEFDPVVVELEL